MKVLIISHNPMNLDENNGRTLRNLFSSFEMGEVAQLFLHSGEVDAPFCQDYYQITDFDVLKSLIKFKKPGRVVRPEETTVNIENNERYGKYSHKTTYVRFARDVLWGFGTWKTKEFKYWLKKYDPDVIFFYASDSVFSQKLARWVQKYLRKPMLIYWVDDFYLKLKYTKNVIDNINTTKYKKVAKKNIESALNICITAKMADAYSKTFNAQFGVLYNTSLLEPFKDKKNSIPLKLTYLGNISCGRYNAINTIGKLIVENNLPIDFRVYSGEYRQEILDCINNQPGVNFFGKVSYEKVRMIMEETDILLHVEDFDEKNVDFCRYSLSTKIADNLMSNRCQLCYGPLEVASIEYLHNEGCSLVANTPEELCELLIKICAHPEILKEYAARGVKIAMDNHNLQKNSNAVRNYLKNAIDMNLTLL